MDETNPSAMTHGDVNDIRPESASRKAETLHAKRRMVNRFTERSFNIYTQVAIEMRPMQDVADEFEVSKPRVSQIVANVEARMFNHLLSSVRAQRVRQTFTLERVAKQALDAWERSKGVQIIEKTTAVTIEGATKDPEDGMVDIEVPGKKVETTRKQLIGDPRFLDVIRDSMKDIRDIWGISQDAETDEAKAKLLAQSGPVVQMVFMDAIGPDGKIRYPKVNKADPVTGELPPLPDGAITLD